MWPLPYVDGQAVTFHDLPPELILEIVSVDWKLIFMLEKVCKALQETLSERTIWASLVSTCINPPLFGPRIRFLNRPITKYTVPELRAMFVRWKKVEHGWQNADKLAFKARQFKPPPEIQYSSIWKRFHNVLVPGGRWMIMFGQDSSASYFDLDSKTLNAIPLIPPQCSDPARGLWRPVSVSKPNIDNTSPTSGLSFRFAVIYRIGDNGGTGGLVHAIQIWNICTVHNNDTGEETLAATKTAEFELESEREVCVYDLEGDMILLDTNFNLSQCYILVNWRDAANNSQKPSCRLLTTDMPIWQANILDDSVLLRTDYDGVPKYTTYEAVPQVPLSNVRRLASSLNQVNDGQEITGLRVPAHFSLMVTGNAMSRTFSWRDNASRSIKLSLLNDQGGRFYAVVYFENGAQPSGSPSTACFSIGTDQKTVLIGGLMGHAVSVSGYDDHDPLCTQTRATLGVATYTKALRCIHAKLTQGHTDIQELLDGDMFMSSQLVTVTRVPIVPAAACDVWTFDDGFDEGTGRVIGFSEGTRTFTILDMIL